MNAGMTTVLDWSHIATTPAHTDAAIQALQGVGHPRRLRLRAELLPAGPATNPYPKDILRLRDQYFSTEDQLVTLALATAGPSSQASQPQSPSGHARHPDVRPISVHVGVGADGPFVKQLADALGRHIAASATTRPTSTRAR